MSESNPTEPQDLNKLISRRNLLKNAELRIKELEQEIADLVEDNQVLLTDIQKEIEQGFKDEERIEELEQQNAELVAYIEDSKHVMMVVANCDTKEAANVIADKWVEQSPKQSLANIQTDAIEDLLSNIKWADYGKNLKDQIEDYANKLREQSK